jgi:hypothetical protein
VIHLDTNEPDNLSTSPVLTHKQLAHSHLHARLPGALQRGPKARSGRASGNQRDMFAEGGLIGRAKSQNASFSYAGSRITFDCDPCARSCAGFHRRHDRPRIKSGDGHDVRFPGPTLSRSPAVGAGRPERKGIRDPVQYVRRRRLCRQGNITKRFAAFYAGSRIAFRFTSCVRESGAYGAVERDPAYPASDFKYRFASSGTANQGK